MTTGGPRAATSVRLPPELASAGRARQLVVDTLTGWGLAHLAIDAALAVSELVANAVLHAHTDLEVVLEPKGTGVRAEVRDQSLHGVSLPWQPEGERPRAPDELEGEAMTGRGLLVVSSVVDAWGSLSNGAGKTVWIEVGTGMPAAPESEGASPLPPLPRPPAPVDGVPIRMVAIPVRLALACDANLDDLIRELQVLTLTDEPIAHAVPIPLIRLIDEILERHADLRLIGREAARRAAATGARLYDFSVTVTPEVVPDLWHLASVLDQVAEFCRAGTLLNLAPSEEVRALRRWQASEIERQVNGAAPRPCPFPVVPYDAGELAVREDVQATARTVRAVAEQAATRLAGLQEVTAGLSRAVDSEQVADVVLGRALALLGASSGSLCLLNSDGESVEIVRAVGYPESVTSHWRRFALSDDLPASETIRTGRAVYLLSPEDLGARYPVFAGKPVLGSRSVAVLPLAVRPGQVLGALVVGYPDAQDFAAADRAFLSALATQAAQAFDRARLHDAERRAHERFAYLAEASAVLNASLELDETLSRLADLAVPRLADWCSIHLTGRDGAPQLVTAAHVDPAKRELAFELHRRWPVWLGEPGIGSCMASGESMLFQVIPVEALEQVARDEDHLHHLLRLGFGSAMVVAIRAGGRVLGALAMANEQGRAVTEAEFALAQDLADRAGAAVANAQLFAERSHVARALQASLLPPALPTATGIEFGARYVAAGQGLEVGGDFYDVFAAGPSWVVAVGDVRGKGVEAAAVTGLARHTIRSRSLSDPSPRAILRQLNHLLLRAEADKAAAGGTSWDLEPLFCTVVAISLTDLDGGVDATICAAGHPLPLVRRVDGSVEPVGVRGDVLGVMDEVDLTDHTTRLGPGDVLIAFTDGITERHRGPSHFGEEGIVAVLRRTGEAGADAIAAHVEEAAKAFVAGNADDDMAVVVVRVPLSGGTCT